MKYLSKYENFQSAAKNPKIWNLLDDKYAMERFISKCLDHFCENKELDLKKEKLTITLASEKFNVERLFIGTNLQIIVETNEFQHYFTGLYLSHKKKVFVNVAEKFLSYEFQKEFLEKNPDKFKDLERIGVNDIIKDEYDYLWNADDMGLMFTENLKIGDTNIMNVSNMKKDLMFTTYLNGSINLRNDNFKVIIDKIGYIINRIYIKESNIKNLNWVYTELIVEYREIKSGKKHTGNIDNTLYGSQVKRLYEVVINKVDVKSYEFQKEFLTKHPERYEDLEKYTTLLPEIRDEYDYLWNADDMGLMFSTNENWKPNSYMKLSKEDVDGLEKDGWRILINDEFDKDFFIYKPNVYEDVFDLNVKIKQNFNGNGVLVKIGFSYYPEESDDYSGASEIEFEFIKSRNFKVYQIDSDYVRYAIENSELFYHNYMFIHENENIFKEYIKDVYSFYLNFNVDNEWVNLLKFNEKIEKAKEEYDYLFKGDEMGLI